MNDLIYFIFSFLIVLTVSLALAGLICWGLSALVKWIERKHDE